MSDQRSEWLPIDVTLGVGVRVTPITVTATATSLDALLNTAVAGRSSMAGRRSLILRNTSAGSPSTPFYILESATQTVTDGWNVESGEDISFDGSSTFTLNSTDYNVANGGGGFYLKTASGTVTAKVLEAK